MDFCVVDPEFVEQDVETRDEFGLVFWVGGVDGGEGTESAHYG